MDGACRPRSFQSDQEIEIQGGITLNNNTILCKTNEISQAKSHDLPNGCVFGHVLLVTVSVLFQARDGQTAEVVAELSLSRVEDEIPRRHMAMGKWNMALPKAELSQKV